jgi:anti-sigma-K factor RskA
MKLDDAQLDGLAAEYALGTLRGQARARLERLATREARIRAAVWRWESYLGGFGAVVPPLAPPARVWRNIRQRIRGRDQAVGVPWWSRWLVALPVTAVALLVAVLLNVFQQPLPDRVAVFTNPAGEAVWVISANTERGLLQARAAAVAQVEAGKTYELWMLPPDGTPRSLGLLPAKGSLKRNLTAATLATLRETGGLAVSIEPLGGSPTGLPTGPVVYQAALTTL